MGRIACEAARRRYDQYNNGMLLASREEAQRPGGKTISFQSSSPGPNALLRVLAEFAGLALPEDRLAELAAALKDLLAGQASLAELDLSHVEPESTFDPRWE